LSAIAFASNGFAGIALARNWKLPASSLSKTAEFGAVSAMNTIRQDMRASQRPWAGQLAGVSRSRRTMICEVLRVHTLDTVKLLTTRQPSAA
jgi:hypothetical protein